MALFAVVPAHNEEANLPGLLDALGAIAGLTVVVVDDGSTDASAAIAARCAHVRLVRHPGKLGYGRALISGFAAALAAGATAIVTIDADGQHRPEQVPRLVAALADDVDIVSGSRYLPGAAAEGVTPAERRDINRTITRELNARTGWTLTDAFCGFKAYRATALARLRLTEPGYAMPLELWAQAFRAGLRVVEQPVDRIYLAARSFGGGLDDPSERLAYYLSVWHRALEAA